MVRAAGFSSGGADRREGALAAGEARDTRSLILKAIFSDCAKQCSDLENFASAEAHRLLPPMLDENRRAGGGDDGREQRLQIKHQHIAFGARHAGQEITFRLLLIGEALVAMVGFAFNYLDLACSAHALFAGSGNLYTLFL